MTKRRVTPEELELWRKVAETTDRGAPERFSISSPLSKPKPRKTPEASAPPKFQIGEKANGKGPTNDVLPSLPDRLAQQPVKMDKKAHGRLKRGKVQPEARIDLHGMTLAQAQPALTGFILSAKSQDKRLVLVITGKGKNSDDGGPIPLRHGALRHAVPQWLSMPPLAPLVLQVTQAHSKHGGGGAYYVYLRRNR